MRLMKKIGTFMLVGAIIFSSVINCLCSDKVLASADKVLDSVESATTIPPQSVVQVFSLTEEEISAEDFRYEIKNEEVYITGYRGSSTTLVIPAEIEGKKVVEIGDYAFNWNSSLISITIPDSIIKIGDHAFNYCYHMTDITIPYGVMEIGDSAFSSCWSLTSVTIPDSVTKIGDYAFSSCDSLTSITIPDSVTMIGNLAFLGCEGLNAFVVGDNNLSYGSIEGVLYNKELTKLIQCPACKIEVKVPDSVTQIENSAFYGCSSLTNITIPDSVTQIGNSAFSGCNSLTSITIPDGVTEIGNSTFSKCSSLTSITIPDSVTQIGNSAFSDCNSLTSITIPDSVTKIGEDTFYYCSSLTSITIPDGVAKIGDSAFSYCENLASIILPDCDIEIGYMVFWETAYMEDEANWEGNALYIDKHLIEARTGDDGSFEIKAGTRTIASKVFGEVSSGPWIWHHTGSNVETVTIPDSVTTIAYQAFCDCRNLTKVEIPSSVKTINRAFDHCGNLEEIKVDEKNTNYSSEDGILYNKAQTEVIQCPGGRTAPVTIPDSVLKIEDCAFFGCGRLTSITIPDNTTEIGDYAFRYCSSFTSIIIPDGVTQIGDGVFSHCSSLTSIMLPDGVARIGGGAFCWCSSLTSINIPDNTRQIGNNAFHGCSNMTSIVMSDSVVWIGEEAFCYCDILEKIYYKGSPEQWEKIEIAERSYIPENIIFLTVEQQSTENGVLFEAWSNVFEASMIPKSDSRSIADISFQVPNGYEFIKAYDIYFMKGDSRAQTNERVILSIPILETNDGNKCKVLYIEESGNVVDMSAIYKDGYMVFQTKHFGCYVVLEEKGISYGDANGDQTIDMKDVVLLRKYMAEFDYDTNTSAVAVEAGADVNGDGIFDMKDVVLLRKYIADFDYDTGTSGVVLGP